MCVFLSRVYFAECDVVRVRTRCGLCRIPFLREAEYRSLVWVHDICVFIHPLTGTWVASTFRLLSLMQQRTRVHAHENVLIRLDISSVLKV